MLPHLFCTDFDLVVGCGDDDIFGGEVLHVNCELRPGAAVYSLEKPKASLTGRMKEPKSSANSPRLFSM
ncbi:hypothetical protein EYF80_058180 [Liparis tanakae]|uniref:Uncharacterized protein n=1 Tax=Liparis tanakae TaxID=230148 RepID=A0A4Z2ESA4_9TELE|nr:hypothetical protein EYF80_058180 [Liparis tanakae]